MGKQTIILLWLAVMGAYSMEAPASDPKLVPQITSFLNSYMEGSCLADEAGIEFFDYRDKQLKYRFSFEKANKLILYCHEYTQNPLISLIDSQLESDGALDKKQALCTALASLTLKEIQLIQVFLFHDHLESVSKDPQDPDRIALSAIRFGDSKRFNAQMQIKARQPGQNILTTIQELIKKLEKEEL